MALGIGANTAIFSVVNAVVLKPLRASDAETLVRLVIVYGGLTTEYAYAQQFKVWRQQTDLFEDVSAHRLEFVNVTAGPAPEQVAVARVTSSFFGVFGARLSHGRTFTADEDRPHGGDVAMLSYGLWVRRFGADPSAVGRTIALGGVPHLIVGIVGPHFDTEQFELRPEVWVPFQYDLERQDGGDSCTVTARLKPGVTVGQADARLRLAYTQSAQRLNSQNSWGARGLHDAMVGSVRSSLNLLFAAVGLVLLIACANVANLLLVRGDVRRREMAIRTAIGAGRGRLIRQLLTECVVLSLAGGVLGLVMGTMGIRTLLTVYPGTNPFNPFGTWLPRIGEGGSAVTADGRVLAFVLLLSVATGVVFGLLPGFQAARVSPQDALKQTGSGSVGRRQRARALLVTGEIAVALMLVIGAGLLIRTSLALRAVKPGFRADHVLTMRMSVTGTRFEKRAGITELTRRGLDRVRAVPGVTAASTTCCMPLETVWQLSFIVQGRPLTGRPFHAFAGWTFVSPGYFDVFRIPVLRGRDFTDRDDADAAGVVIINQEMARRFWPDSDPLNDRLLIGRSVRPDYDQDPIRQIIGIVGDIRDTALTSNPRPQMFVPVAQVPDGVTTLNVRLLPLVWIARTRDEPQQTASAIEKHLEAASGLAVARVRSMDEVVAESTSRARFDMWLMTLFGCSALLLAAIGVYGLMAYSVQLRTPEIGIRLALGASAGRVRNMVIKQGMKTALAGVAIGLLAAYALARVLAGFLFGVTIHDPYVFVAVPLLLTTVAFVAVWLPGQRASRVDPLVALRAE